MLVQLRVQIKHLTFHIVTRYQAAALSISLFEDFDQQQEAKVGGNNPEIKQQLPLQLPVNLITASGALELNYGNYLLEDFCSA